MNELERTL